MSAAGGRVADSGAAITIERDPARPGWLCIVVERSRGPRRLWLADDEAAQAHALLGKEIPTVTVRQAGR